MLHVGHVGAANQERPRRELRHAALGKVILANLFAPPLQHTGEPGEGQFAISRWPCYG